MGDLTTNFSSWEFECQCGCGADQVDEGFVHRLQLCRNQAGFSFNVNSGCRCEEHNKNEGGKSESDHVTNGVWRCEGVDIAVANSRERYKILEAAFDVKFRRVGIAYTFIHLGTALRNPQQVTWLY